MTDTNPRSLIQRLTNDLEGITEELVIPEYAHTEKERTDASLALISEARDYLCQTESHAPIDAANRIAHYLEQRQLIRGLDQDVIHALHAGTDEPRRAALTATDLKTLVCDALAQPEPEGPTDEEILAIAAASIDPYQDSGIAIGEYEPETERAVEVYGSELIAFARAVLARWGHFIQQGCTQLP